MMEDTSPSFWYKQRPRCDGQGWLIIKKEVPLNLLFFCCDEGMSCWRNAYDLTRSVNRFMEYEIDVEVASATEEDIVRHGWEQYCRHRTSEVFYPK